MTAAPDAIQNTLLNVRDLAVHAMEQEIITPATPAIEVSDQVLGHLRFAQQARPGSQEERQGLLNAAALCIAKAVYSERTAQ